MASGVHDVRPKLVDPVAQLFEGAEITDIEHSPRSELGDGAQQQLLLALVAQCWRP
jgi:hypothetical protein